jgi:hypothetical protein
MSRILSLFAMLAALSACTALDVARTVWHVQPAPQGAECVRDGEMVPCRR